MIKEVRFYNICKEKFVDFSLLVTCANVEQYNKFYEDDEEGKLTKDEFDFMREAISK